MKLSVIICTYNREKYILDSLVSLRNQSLIKDKYEIIIVNNNSTDKTDEICRKFVADYSMEFKIIYVIETKRGLSFARNRGIMESEGEVITFIDDDAIAEPDFLLSIYDFMIANSQVDAVGGKVIPIYGSGLEPEWLSKYTWGLVSKVDEGEKIKPFKKKYPAGCNMTIRKKLLLEVNGFNTKLKIRSDDKDLFTRIYSLGKSVYYLPNASVKHNIDSYRLEPEFIKKLCYIIGESERIRLEGKGMLAYISKLFEYVLKLIASLIIAIGFIIKSEKTKAMFLIKVRGNILIGFFKENVK